MTFCHISLSQAPGIAQINQEKQQHNNPERVWHEYCLLLIINDCSLLKLEEATKLVCFKRLSITSVAFCLQLLFTPFLSSEALAEFIGGSTPGKRPDAPVINAVKHDGSWFEQALTGVEQPYPYSLRFLEDQGNWYTPFNRPGMTGKYDIRGWHSAR